MTAAATARGRDAGLALQYLITAPSAKETTMRDIATATLSGNLTREVELRDLPSGAAVARLRIATTTRRRNGDAWVDKTNYFTVEVYGGHAHACAEHLSKGSRVVIDAELDWREWTDQQEHKREAVTLRARHVLFEGRRAAPADSPNESEPTSNSPATSEPTEAPVGAGAIGDVGEAHADDLPF